MRRGLISAFFGSAFLAVALSPDPLPAQIQPVGELRDMCFGEGVFQEDLKEKAEGLCWGFIAAVGEILLTGNTVSGFAACPPLGEGMAERGEIIRLVKDYLDSYRDDPQIPGSVAIAQGLAEAFPCE